MQLSHWVEHEMQTLRLGDKRLHPRLFAILDTLARYPEATIPEAFGNWSDTKAFYRFCDSDNVEHDQIRSAHCNATRKRVVEHSRILAIQDTTSFNFNSHLATTDLGPIDRTLSQGFFVHSVFAATPTGLPLGLLQQFVWSRDADKKGISAAWRKRSLFEKETLYWYFGLHDCTWQIPDTLSVVCVCDRQGDFFELFAKSRPQNCDLLVRAAYDRALSAEEAHLFAALEQAPLAGYKKLCLRSHHHKERREVKLAIRFRSLRLKPPSYLPGYAPVQMQAILAEEVEAPAGEEPLRWVLLTSCAVETLADACLMLEWYAHRWLIERFHFVLKSGCHLEQLQLQTRKRLLVALSLYNMVAWRLLWLTYLAREEPDQSCEVALAAFEWQGLYCVLHKTSLPPPSPPSLREAVRWIARLGGFLARKGDGEPGVKVLWRGLRRLEDISQTWRLLCDQNCG